MNIPVFLPKVPEKNGDIIPNNYGWTFSETSFFSPNISRYIQIHSDSHRISRDFHGFSPAAELHDAHPLRERIRILRRPPGRYAVQQPAVEVHQAATAGRQLRQDLPKSTWWIFVVNTIGESVTHIS